MQGPSPDGVWVLHASLGTVDIGTPFGSLRPDPALSVAAGAGLFASSGNAAITLGVPADPGLVGLRVFWQAFLTAPPRLTNRETTALTNL